MATWHMAFYECVVCGALDERWEDDDEPRHGAPLHCDEPMFCMLVVSEQLTDGLPPPPTG